MFSNRLSHSLTSARTLFARALLLLCTFPGALPAAPERWAEEIAKLTATEATLPTAPGSVVFVGSSSIRLWSTLAADFPGVRVLNRGFGGSELADSVFYADRLILPHRPRTVVVYAGENDLWAGKSPEAVLADFQAFRKKIHAALPPTRVIFLSIKFSPARARIHEQIRAANRLIGEDCATDPRCTFVDVATPLLGADGALRPDVYVADGIHLSPAGYAIWARLLAPHLED